MEKAFDMKALVEKCREKGGPDAEKLVKANWAAVKEWLMESAMMSDNQIVKAAIPLSIPVVDNMLMPVLDQIDGKAG